MSKEQREAIKSMIEQTKLELKAQKILLEQVKEADAKPFVETKLMRGYLHTVSALTRPFAALRRDSRMALDNPLEFRRLKMLNKADRLLDQAIDIKDLDNDPRRKVITRRVHDHIMELELEEEKGDWGDLGSKADRIQSGLRDQLQRLRPPVNEKRAEEVKEQLGNMMSSLQETMKANQIKDPKDQKTDVGDESLSLIGVPAS